MPRSPIPVGLRISALWNSFRRGSRQRRETLVRQHSAGWNLVAEVLEQRTLLAAPTLDWGVSFGTSNGLSTINSTAVDASGDVYVAGVVTRGTVDLDPGAGTANVTADNQTGFVAKYDPVGNFLWVETFASDTSVNSFSLTVDAAGGVYVAGGFRGTTTFGVGGSNPATLVSQGGYSENGFVARLDQTTGDIAWVDGVLGDLGLATTNVAVDASGRIFIAGQAGSGTITITDGESGAVLETFSTTASNYVTRLDATGAVIWAEGFAEGKATIVAGSGLGVDSTGNVYLTGALRGKNVDFDPGSGSFTLSRTSRSSNTFAAKLDVDGNFVWATKDDAAGYTGTSGSSIAVDSSGNAYLTMQQTGSGWRWECGGRDGGEQLLARIDSSGNWQWTKTLVPVSQSHPKCADPPPSCNDRSNSTTNTDSDRWSHGGESSVPCWTPPVTQYSNGHHGSGADHFAPRGRNASVSVSSSTAKVAVDSSGNAIVVSARSGATAYSSTGTIVWSTSTPLPVTDIAVDATGNIVFTGMFRNELNVSPDGTYLLDSNTWWRKAAPFLVRWKSS